MQQSSIFSLFVALMAAILCSACSLETEDPEFNIFDPAEAARFATDRGLIEAYVVEEELEGFFTEDSVFIAFQVEQSEGDSPTITNSVDVIYRGYLLDGREFDDSEGEVRSFPLQGLIIGWQIALPFFKRGERATIIVPSRYGYGNEQNGIIPPNSVIAFDIELVDF